MLNTNAQYDPSEFSPTTYFRAEQSPPPAPTWGSASATPEFVPAPAVFPTPARGAAFGYVIPRPAPQFDPASSSSALWISRGLLVGLLFGAGFGSFVPFLGTVVGGGLGLIAGLGLGVIIAILSAITRNVAPRSPGTTSDRERIIAIITIVSCATLISAQMNRGGAMFLWLAALPGIIHAALANPPVDGAIYTGVVSERLARILRALPVVITVIALVVFFGALARN
jgi:hypothetical protein